MFLDSLAMFVTPVLALWPQVVSILLFLVLFAGVKGYSESLGVLILLIFPPWYHLLCLHGVVRRPTFRSAYLLCIRPLGTIHLIQMARIS